MALVYLPRAPRAARLIPVNNARMGVIIACSFCFIPLLVFVWRNYLYYRRGWHEADMQYQAVFWFARLLLAPALAWYMQKSMAQVKRVPRAVMPVAGLLFYLLLQWGISILVLNALPLADRRLWNMFNTVKQQPFLLNLFIYTITALLFYVWEYYERSKNAGASINQLKQQLAQVQAEMQAAKQQIQPAIRPMLESLTIKTGQKAAVIAFGQIICMQANGAYIKIITQQATHLLSMPMRDVEKIIPGGFVRVHRSAIVNTAYVKEVKSLLNGDYLLTLKNGLQLRASRTYRQNLRAVIRAF